jgi:hypothetical protein
MFEDKRREKRPKIGRKQVEINPNAMGEGFIMQVSTRTADGYDYSKPLFNGAVFISYDEAEDYRKIYIYKGKSPKGGIDPSVEDLINVKLGATPDYPQISDMDRTKPVDMKEVIKNHEPRDSFHPQTSPKSWERGKP